jgi:hypothetical protein
VINAVGQGQIGLTGVGVANLKFFGVPNNNYVLQTATNLSGPWWPFSTNTAASDGSMQATDPNATNSQQYYRATQP